MLTLVSCLLFAATLTSSSPTSHSSSGPAPRSYNDNLTPDGYYHDRYHAIMSMASYGDYNDLCPAQTFSKATELKNFPNSTRPPWQVISTFGPTPSGCEGYTAIVPEMNKALIIFKGNLQLEQNLPLDVVDWSGIGMLSNCSTCTANAFAMKGYLECKEETNNWEAIVKAYEGQSLVFSIGGHGIGGMHAVLASIDLNNQHIDYYSHTYGSPRVLNQAGAFWYNSQFNGEAGVRGVYGNDLITEIIPEGPNYVHTGTPFYYSGFDPATQGPTLTICWDANETSGNITTDDACIPHIVYSTAGLPSNTTSLEDHYYYHTEVTQCGGPYVLNVSIIDNFLASPGVTWNASAASTNLPIQSIAAADATFSGAAKVSGVPTGAASSGSGSSGSGSGGAAGTFTPAWALTLTLLAAVGVVVTV